MIFMKTALFYIFSNILFWIVVHFLSSILVHFIPDKFYNYKNIIFREKKIENKGLLYKKYLFIHKWKDKIPEAGKFLPLHPFSKKHFESKKKEYIERFIRETCRGELAHILPFFFLPICFIWNPLLASIMMSLYAILSNTPFILVQRYNRIRLVKLLKYQFSGSI